MVDDAEYYYPFHQNLNCAHKPHKCDECGRQIEVGETYEVATGLLEGHWDRWKTCAHCVWARRWLISECNGWCFSFVYEDLLEHWEEDPLFATLDLGRRIVGIRNKWQRNGKLMPVPA
jgi:hypothetical protein